jgi:NADH-quinone oxidoreductase subunit M
LEECVATESAILSVMLALPAVGGGIVLALPARHARRARVVALAVLGATLVLACIAAGWIAWGRSGEVQLVTRVRFLPWAGGEYFVGVDGLSMPLVLLTAAMGVVACWASYGIGRSVRAYCALLMWTLAGMLGALVSLNLLLLVVFLELAFVPLYFLVGIWGGVRKEYAASKLLLFSLVGMVGMIVFLAWAWGAGGDGAQALDLTRIRGAERLGSAGVGMFWLLMAAVGIRMGLVPLHTWVGDVLVEAPMPVALLVVAAATKLGAYVLLRVALPLFEENGGGLAWYGLAGIGAVSIVYGALAALAQRDARRVIAFGAIVQSGYVLLATATRSPLAVAGAGYSLVADAVALGMLVLVMGMIADRTGHCEIKRLGGLWGHMPALSGWGALAFLAAMGLPGLTGFFGHLLMVLGTYGAGGSYAVDRAWAQLLGAIAAGATVLTGAVFIWTYQRIFLGAPKPEHSNVARLSASEKWLLAAMGIAVVVLGVVPGILVEPVRTWVEAFVR